MRYRFTLSHEIAGSDVLSTDPKGWDSGDFTIKRSPEYHGMMFERTLTLEFFCNGAGKEFIDNVYDTYGVDAIIDIKVELACGANEIVSVGGSYSDDYSDDYLTEGYILDDANYQEVFTGELDLMEYCKDTSFTRVRIVEKGQAQTITSRLDTKVDLLKLESIGGVTLTPFTYGPFAMTMHGKQIVIRSALGITGTAGYTDGAPLTDGGDEVRAQMPFEDVLIDDLSGVGVPTDFVTDVDGSQAIFTNSGENRTFDVDYNIVGTYTELSSGDRDYTLRLVMRGGETPDGAPLYLIQDYGSKSATGGNSVVQNINESGTISIGLASGHNIWFYLEIIPTNVGPTPIITTAITLSCTTASFVVTDDDLRPDTESQVFAIYEAGARICQSITDELDPLRSTYFGRKNAEPYAESANGCGSFMTVTSGKLLRQYPITGTNASTIFMSLSEYFKTLDAIHDIGLGIEKRGDEYKIVIERKDYFYDSVSDPVVTLNNVPDITTCVDPDTYTNQVDIGYEKWELEEVNGIDEFNTKHQYSLGYRTADKKIEKFSPSIAGGYAIEYTRRQKYNNFSTTDWKYDNDNFVICTSRSVDGSGNPDELDIAEKDENFDDVNNLISPDTAYNIRISPTRNFLRHFKTLVGGLTKYAGRLIKFTYGEGNYAMETDQTDTDCPGSYNSALLTEGQDIQWDGANVDEGNPIWIPEIYEFDYPLTATQFQSVRANPYKRIRFSSGTTDYKSGFILELKYNPLGGLTHFKLLRSYVD